MERDSFLYKARRQCQVIAHKIMPDEVMCKFYSRILLKKKVDLKNPQTFNDEVLKKHGIDAYFSEDRTYIIALRNILKKVKEIIEKGNDVPDVYYNEIEADIASLYLWKEATKEEVVKIINSYGIYDVVANNIPRKLLLDDNIY